MAQTPAVSAVTLNRKVKSPDRRVAGVGGMAGLSKQKKLPVPLQPEEFSPPSENVKPKGLVIVPETTVPGAGWLKAMELMPVLPPSVSEAVFSPEMTRVKYEVRPSALIEFWVRS